MNIIEIINKKRTNQELTKNELEFAINGYINNEVKDYQISSLLMAICINGMTYKETSILTEIMYKSGDIIDATSIKEKKVDKHSTGGVGDKTTLILLPLVASCGVKSPKMSGRGLGFTGGTIDKLESIDGFNTKLEINDFLNQVKEIDVAIASQTGNLVPADKLLYALRDVTGTVESIPLIASSIMSKKLASGADTIVIDLKVGNGALMKTLETARELAKTMVEIGKHHNRVVICVLTSMEQPLGNKIGNSLEVEEAIEVLKGKGPKDVIELITKLGTLMVSNGLGVSEKVANLLINENLKNGNAYNKFLELVKRQGGDLSNLESSKNIISVKSNKTGFIKKIETEKIGEIVRKLGGGRYNKEDEIDYKVGLRLSKKLGDYILEDEEIVKIYAGKKDIIIDELLECFVIDETNGTTDKLILEVIK